MSKLDKLIAALREQICYPENADDALIAKCMQEADLDLSELEDFIHYDSHRYTRSLIALDVHFSLLLICWEDDQATPVHTHADDCKSWVRVLKGSICIASDYECDAEGEFTTARAVKHLEGDEVFLLDGCPAARKMIVAAREHESASPLPFATNCFAVEKVGYHKTHNCNREGKQRTISLHLYTPPYIECRYLQGKGPSKELTYVPVVHCPSAKTNEELHLLKKCTNRNFYGNFSQLVDVLRNEVIVTPEGKHSKENIEQVTRILNQIQFNPREWEQYSKFEDGHYTRNLIGYDEKFTILLLCWEKGQFSPIHDHAGSNCWVKVLQGDLEETLYDLDDDGVGVTRRSSTVYGAGGVTYISDLLGVHKMGNPSSTTACCSLHVYSPAYHECHIFAEDEPVKTPVSITTAYGTVFPFMEKQLQCSTPSCKKHIASLNLFVELLRAEFASKGVEAEVHDYLGSLHLSTTEWNQYLHFSPHQYTRNLLAYNEHFSLVLVCWNPSQKTPVHDHGKDGRLAWVRVLSGSLVFKKFEENEFGQMEPKSEEPLTVATGSTIKLVDDELGFHQTMNASSTEVAVSLHLYAPPYVECHFNVKGQDKLIPVAYCAKETEAGTRMQFKHNVFTSCAMFCGLLTKMVEQQLQTAGKICKEQIRCTLERMEFNEAEWKHVACCCSKRPARTLVGYTKDFSVHIICWDVDQSSSVHNHHGSTAWVKVLSGALREEHYKKTENGLEKAETRNLVQGGTYVLDDHVIHKTGNTANDKTYTMHIYAPPFKEYGCDDVQRLDLE